MGCWCAWMRLVARSQITDYARLIALTSRATPLGFEPRITPPKGAVLPLHHGVIGWPTYDSRRRNGSCNSRNEKVERLLPAAGCYSFGFGRRMSTVVPLP